MRIAFDAKRAAQNTTGLGNYSRFILDIAARYMGGETFLLYTPDERRLGRLGAFLAGQAGQGTGTCPGRAGTSSQSPVPRFQLRTPQGLWRLCRSLWRTVGIPGSLREEGADLYVGLSNELPLNIRKAQCRSAVVIHDVIFRSFPQGYKPIDRRIYDYKMRRACENADRIIAVSEFTKREVMRYYGAHLEEKIRVAYQGCDAQFRRKADDAAKAEARRVYNLPDRYILYVGSIEERKNLLLLVKALQRLPEGTRLVACGKKTPYYNKVREYAEQNGLTGRITFLHGVEFRHLPAIYQQADVFVYPSRIEGFGIPMLEALCSGVPAIGCTGSCLEEAGGPGSLYVDPDDDKALADAITRINTDPALRQRMTDEGYRHAALFEEERLAEGFIRSLTADAF